MSAYGDQFLPSGEQYLWNASALKDWEKCPRYYQYRWIDGLAREDSVHLTFGSHYAWALMRFFQLRAEGMDRAEARERVVAALLEQTWDYSHDWKHVAYEEGGEDICQTCGVIRGHTADDCTGRPWTPDPANPSYKDRWTLIRTFVWYLDEFRDDLPLYTVDGRPAVETQFRIAVDDGNAFVGTLDRVVVYGDSPWIMDQKTTGGYLNSKYFRGYHLDTQMSMYIWAGQAVLPDAVGGVIIDAVQIQAGGSIFGRGLTMRTKSQLEEWYDEAMLNIEAARTATRERRFPRNTQSCDKYGGCSFREICEASPEVRKTIIRRKYATE
jgi:hypothetical protein